MSVHTIAVTGPAITVGPLEEGDILELRLAENPTTGYVWTIVALPENLVFIAEDFESSFVPGPNTLPEQYPVGTGGVLIYRFRAHGGLSGEEIHLVHNRPWKPEDELAKAVVSIA